VSAYRFRCGYRTPNGGYCINACDHCGRDMCRIKDAVYIDIECREECVAKGPQLSPRLVTGKRPVGRPRKNRTVAAEADTTRIIGRAAELCASLSGSIAQAADRHDTLTVTVHAQQVLAATATALATIRELGPRETSHEQE
jgi:hypothetical protein